VSPVKYQLGFYIPENGILHSKRHENLKPKNLKVIKNGPFWDVTPCDSSMNRRFRGT
jgi:hypothetical protein